MRPKIDILGTGNVGWHLERTLSGKVDMRVVDPHNPSGVRADARVVVIAVSDDAIPAVLRELPVVDGVVCHTSGSTPLDVIPGRFPHRGVLYPLNTFTRGIEVDLQSTPVFIEASDPESRVCLRHLAEMISDKVSYATSAQRQALHIAAVLSCNYVNRLWALSERLLSENNLDFGLLKPLIKTTFDKISVASPEKVQTGPAARGDMLTVRRHLSTLGETPLAEVYRVLADNILSEGRKKKK